MSKQTVPLNTISTTHTPNWNRLFAILNERRPHGTEQATASRWLSPYGYELFENSKGESMAYGIDVSGPNNTASTTLFNAHLDTVHKHPGKRKVKYDQKAGIVSSTDGTPLGADDGAGVWLLLEMIDAGVPGYYLFTVGEECGGIGAKFMATNHILKSFDRAIAFDRRGTSSVITHQAFGRCCSDVFAQTLADELNFVLPDGYAYLMPDDTGIYTDTAEYIDVIPECTNLSTGYNFEHTAHETLDINYLAALRDACITIDWGALPTERDPSEVEMDEFSRIADKLNHSYDNNKCSYKYASDFPDNFKDIINTPVRDLAYMVQTCDPDLVADIIQDLAYEIADLKGYWK